MKKLCILILKVIDFACVVLLFLMFSSMTLQIVCRFLPKAPVWTEEFARVCFVLMSYLAVPLCLAEGSHVAVDMLVNVLPKPLQRVIDIIIYASVIFLGVVFIRSHMVNIRSSVGVTTITMNWLKLNWIYTAECLFFAMTIAVSAMQIVMLILGKGAHLRVLEPRKSTLTEEDLGL